MAEDVRGPLAGLRVIDLCDRGGEMAGRILAELGATVLKVEPPGGVNSRRLPPFDERPGRAGESLYWAALGRGKLSAVADLGSGEDREKLRRLCAGADVLVESLPPGFLGGVGLGYGELRKANPGLVYCSITPYGQDGPKAGWPAAELTLEAAAGRVSLQGDRDRPPIPIGYPQVAFHAGAQAACDILIALHERDFSGLGQHLDTSMQAAMTWTLMDATGYPPAMGVDPPGAGDDRASVPEIPMLRPAPCADGYVLATILPDKAAAAVSSLAGDPAVRPLLEAAGEGDVAEAVTVELAYAALEAFIANKTKAELMDWAVRNRVRVAPVNTTADILASPHLAERRFFCVRDGRPHLAPAARLSRTPLRAPEEAPALGSDQALLEGGFTASPFPVGGRVEPGGGEGRAGAFAGLRVADFSWVAAGPLTAKALADHGATVVHVESAARIDLIRQLPPFKDGLPGVERSRWYANVNTSKLGLTLDLGNEAGRELAARLCRWADVVIESFTPGVMERFGLGYEELSRDRPDLVMVSTSLLGHSGPWAAFGGYGNHGAGLSGFHWITGWPDRPPAGPAGPYTDVITPRFLVSALAAALLERRRSGLGQHIELSQVEAAIHFLEPLLLDEAVNGRTAAPAGLSSATACPHGVYPTAGKERYIAIAVEEDEQWRALAGALPAGALEGVSYAGRETADEDRARIDRALAAWTAGWEGRELESLLVSRGVPASVVQRTTDLYGDPQLAHRGFFVTLDHPETGPTPFDGFATRFSLSAASLRRPAPLLGGDSEFVLRELLGLSAAEYERCREAGALR